MKTSCSSLPQNLSIPVLVNRIREDVLSSSDMHLFVSPSAYDTAWLAMIRDPNQPHDLPLFGDCLAWVLSNQRAEGFWGEVDGYGRPTIDTLPATLVCMVALTMWNVGHRNIEKGVAFLHSNAEKLLRKKSNRFPRWFLLVFPAMVEHAKICGLGDLFPNGLGTLLASIFKQRQHILETESLVDRYQYPPLLSYLETLPVTYDIEQDDIVSHLSRDGSLFQSPSATACAFMVTRHPKCLGYLQSLVRKRSNGVPPMYPVDEGLIKLCVVNHLQRLGIAEHFTVEIEKLLEGTYSHYISQEPSETNIQPAQIYKDSLAFRLLRMHGYKISPKKFCWFLHHEDIVQHMEKNWEYFSGVMLNVYGATQIMFLGENELDQAKSFSRKLLEKTISLNNTENDLIMITNSIDVIKHELTLPWITRLDHADHRMWIEQNEMPSLWMGKASFYRVSCLHHNDLMQLAVENYEFRQSIYRSELEKLMRWSKDHSLSDIGFGREKTAYCYFAVAACGVLPPTSDIRVIIAKSAVIITVADDYFDSKGSLGELINLTEAIRRWDGKGLSGPSKIIFDALVELVNDMANRHINLQGCDITKDLRYIWTETFDSWLMEASWSRSQYVPSMDEYLVTGMTSIAVHTIVLPAWCILNSSLPNHKLIKPPKYEAATKLLMMITRLLNDIQSYQKEQEDGKFNSVLLYLKENPEADIDDSITRVREILNKKTKEFLEHVLMDGLSNLPSSCRHLHLSCLKVFQMFFNSSNRFDSDTALRSDIQKAMYIPLQVPASQPTKHLLRRHHGMSDEKLNCENRLQMQLQTPRY